jgi:hypothetical protein
MDIPTRTIATSKEKEYMKVMNVKNWKELVQNRNAWNYLVEKAKTHKEL